jgi:NADH-quinone oxidoreductase subunit J
MFLAFAIIALGGALALLTQRSAIQAALCMMLSFLGIAGLFLLLSNPVAAALQVIIYGGAITILVLFVVMLLQSHKEEAPERRRPIHGALSVLLVLSLAAGAVRLVFGSETLAKIQGASSNSGTMTLHKLGEQLFSDHLVALEAVGLLLLAAMIAAVVLVKREV